MSITRDEHLEYIREEQERYAVKSAMNYDRAVQIADKLHDNFNNNDSIDATLTIRHNVPPNGPGVRKLIDCVRIMEVCRENHNTMHEDRALDANTAIIHLLLMTKATVI